MTRRLSAIAALALALTLVSASGASAADKTGTVVVGTTTAWQGTQKTGTNPYYFRQAGPQPSELGPFGLGRCSAQPYESCETVLLEFSNPLTEGEIEAGVKEKLRPARISIGSYAPVAQCDFDLVIYRSDAEGTKGAQITSSGNNPGQAENVNFDVLTTPTEPSMYVLAHVVYFLVPNSSYQGQALFL